MKIFLVLVVLCSIALTCVGCSAGEQGSNVTEAPASDVGNAAETEAHEETIAITDPPVNDIVIETAYFTLTVPGEYATYIEHREVTEDGVAMEIFSMTKENDTWELFRVYLNDETIGNSIGNFFVDDQKIPITVSVCEYTSDVFADEETEQLYYKMMEFMSHVLTTIRSDSRFISKEEVVVEKENEKVTYWTFSLPQNMEWEESEADGNYRIEFSGTVNGEKHMLYAVAVGETPLKTVLGMYTVDGTAKPVSVESYELPDTSDWEQNHVSELYVMMETINDVIQTIMESENFSAELPEG